MKYLVLIWVDKEGSATGEWQVYWWGITRREAEVKFREVKGMYAETQLVRVDRLAGYMGFLPTKEK